VVNQPIKATPAYVPRQEAFLLLDLSKNLRVFEKVIFLSQKSVGVRGVACLEYARPRPLLSGCRPSLAAARGHRLLRW
jgi:hypothetical protein